MTLLFSTESGTKNKYEHKNEQNSPIIDCDKIKVDLEYTV
jgi:hypothetical protein